MTAYRLRKLWQSLASRRRALFYRLLGMKIRGPVWLEAIEWPDRPGSIILHRGAALDRGVVLLATRDEARIEIGESCYVNRHTMFDASVRIEVGSQSMVGPHCYITDHDHTFGSGLAPGETPLISVPTVIGKRCWLGANVTILKGVTIGDGSVIAAGSVVTKSVPAGVLAAGVPARILREFSGTAGSESPVEN